MKNNKKIIIIIVVGVVILTGIGYYIYKNNNRFSWYEDYRASSDDPYGGKVVSELLKNYFPGKGFHVIENSLKEELKQLDPKKKYNYVFVGNAFYTDSISTQRLIDFVRQGNTAFIATNNLGYNMLQEMFTDSCFDEDEFYMRGSMDSITTFNFYNTSLKRDSSYHFQYVFRNKPLPHEWSYFDSLFFCEEKYIYRTIGYQFKNEFNFISVQVGKGKFYLHSSPVLFTNYALLDKDIREYTEKTFSFLPAASILWDEVTKIPGNFDYNADPGISKSPLQFILSEESLRWAWYIILFSVALYLLFFSKRRQRIIPVLASNTNTSLEYVQTIGLLYLQQQDNRLICRHKMKLLQSFIRNRYSINTNKTDNWVFDRLSAKSSVPVNEIKDIFTDYKWIEDTHEVDNNLLIQFYSKIENFYKKCK